jgi:hypothetical protein
MANNSIQAIDARRKARGLPPLGSAVSTSATPTADELKRLKEGDAKRKKAATKRKQESLKAGDNTYQIVPFVGSTALGQCRVQRKRIRTMLIPTFIDKAGELKSDASGKKVGDKVKIKSKPIQVSYGFKLKARKKAIKGGRGGSTTQVQETAWITLSVPMDATFEDVIFWCKTFGKVPKLVRVGQHQVQLAKMESAGANI